MVVEKLFFRVARSIEDRIGGGEFLYKHLSVAKIEFKYPAYGIEERMTSRWATDLSKTVKDVEKSLKSN